jgi:hypothetical protein
MQEKRQCQCPGIPTPVPTSSPTQIAPTVAPTVDPTSAPTHVVHSIISSNVTLGCRAAIGKVLRNVALPGKTLNGVSSASECCSLCGKHLECGSWEYSSERVCVLMRGAPKYHSLFAQQIVTWAGPRPSKRRS